MNCLDVSLFSRPLPGSTSHTCPFAAVGLGDQLVIIRSADRTVQANPPPGSASFIQVCKRLIQNRVCRSHPNRHRFVFVRRNAGTVIAVGIGRGFRVWPFKVETERSCTVWSSVILCFGGHD